MSGLSVLPPKRSSVRKERELFKEAMEKIHQPCAESRIAETLEQCINEAEEIGYPVIVRPAYTLGGTGGGIANSQEELVEIASAGTAPEPCWASAD